MCIVSFFCLNVLLCQGDSHCFSLCYSLWRSWWPFYTAYAPKIPVIGLAVIQLQTPGGLVTVQRGPLWAEKITRNRPRKLPSSGIKINSKTKKQTNKQTSPYAILLSLLRGVLKSNTNWARLIVLRKYTDPTYQPRIWLFLKSISF